MPKAVGIDLGTTSSVVSVLEAGEATVIPNAEGARSTPSIVGFPPGGHLVFGEAARRQAITNPGRTVRSVTRHLGTAWTIRVDGHVYTAQEICACLLRRLKYDAEVYLGDEVTQAVITVPGKFDHAQRRAIREAARLAGLEVLRLIGAAPAAAIGSVWFADQDHDEMVVVFDLGGGTLDVAVIEIGEGVFEVKSAAGRTDLGGDDWDQRIVDWLVTSLRRDGVELSGDPAALQYLSHAAETAKIALSVASEATITLPFAARAGGAHQQLEYQLTRANFEDLTADLVKACRGCLDRALRDAYLPASTFRHVLLVGGSSRMPAVQELVATIPRRGYHTGVNPDEVAALGAALQAGALKGEVRDLLLLDATPLPYSIETKGGNTAVLIEANTTIPTRRSQVFTASDVVNAPLGIHLLEGPFERAAANESLGYSPVEGRPGPKDDPSKVTVTVDIDWDATVTATATAGAPWSEKAAQVPGGDSVVVDRPGLRATNQSITYGAEVVSLDEIDGVAYRWFEQKVNGSTTSLVRMFHVASRGKTLKIALNGFTIGSPANEAAWRALVGLSQQVIEPRLSQVLVDSLRQGDEVQVGRVTIDSSGVTHKAWTSKVTHIPWDRLDRAELVKGEVVIMAKSPKDRFKKVATLQSIEMNAVLLPSVLQSASTLFRK